MLGRLTVICGGMFAGKTEELIRRLNRLKYAKQEYEVFKHIFDDGRYGTGQLVTHNNMTIKCISASTSNFIYESVIKRDKKPDVVAIDEAQFFDDKQLTEVVAKFIKQGISVMVAGLDMTSDLVPFGEMGNLLCMADEVVKLRAVCSVCYSSAGKSKKIIESDKVIDVGNTNKYEARCRRCFKL